MGVELVMELVSCGFAHTAAVVDLPALRRPQTAHMPLAEFAGARIVGRGVKPDRERAGIERERGRRDRTATRSRTLTCHRT